jgi:hypothetical protein
MFFAGPHEFECIANVVRSMKLSYINSDIESCCAVISLKLD